jgi:serine/threonine protein kinase
MLEGLMNKVVHCDMKPENALIAQSGFPSLRIIDFDRSGSRGSNPSRAGSIAARDDPVTADGPVIIGTPLFPGETEHEVPSRSSLSPLKDA